jgi:cytochrome c oxidase assembly protein subunit 15
MSADVSSLREEGENSGLHRFALFTACSTAFLIFVGGLVTSTESGLAVPDWPLSYGMLFPPMVGGIFYEHGHRMVASFVGLLTVILAIWTWLRENRSWVRWLSLGALVAVIFQGLLGGLTVIYLLPTPISVTHACLAQTFFCLTIAIALFTSPAWKKGLPAIDLKGTAPTLPALSAATTAVIYLQLVLGALMRHTDSGLAIPDFPLSFGRVVPDFASGNIMIAFAHRIGAVAVAVMIVWTSTRIFRMYSDRALLYRPAMLLLLLLCLQITLGAFTVWTAKSILVTTAHVANGAVVLGVSLLLTLRAYGMAVNTRPTLLYSIQEPAWK